MNFFFPLSKIPTKSRPKAYFFWNFCQKTFGFLAKSEGFRTRKLRFRGKIAKRFYVKIAKQFSQKKLRFFSKNLRFFAKIFDFCAKPKGFRYPEAELPGEVASQLLPNPRRGFGGNRRFPSKIRRILREISRKKFLWEKIPEGDFFERCQKSLIFDFKKFSLKISITTRDFRRSRKSRVVKAPF